MSTKNTRLDNLIKRRDEVKLMILRLTEHKARGNEIHIAAYRKELEKLEGQIETEKTA